MCRKYVSSKSKLPVLVRLISAFAAGMRPFESMDVVRMGCAVHVNKHITAIPCLHERDWKGAVG